MYNCVNLHVHVHICISINTACIMTGQYLCNNLASTIIILLICNVCLYVSHTNLAFGIYIRTYLHTYGSLKFSFASHIYMYVHIHVYMYVCMYACMFVCI